MGPLDRMMDVMFYACVIAGVALLVAMPFILTADSALLKRCAEAGGVVVDGACVDRSAIIRVEGGR